jgi:hypothetical protein
LGVLCLRIFMSKMSCLLEKKSVVQRRERGEGEHFRETMKTEEDRERKQRMEKEKERERKR